MMAVMSGIDVVEPLRSAEMSGAGLRSHDASLTLCIHIVQSKIFAFLVPPTCTNACKSGTTRQPADEMYLWVRPTHPKLYSLYYNHDIVLVVGRQYKDIMI